MVTKCVVAYEPAVLELNSDRILRHEVPVGRRDTCRELLDLLDEKDSGLLALENYPVTGVDFLAGWIAGSIMVPHNGSALNRERCVSRHAGSATTARGWSVAALG